MDIGNYYKYKCPNCGARSSKVGICRECGIGTVIPIDVDYNGMPKKTRQAVITAPHKERGSSVGKVMKCKTCGELIAKSAKICPHCGARNRQIGAGTAIALVILAVVWIVSLNTLVHYDGESESADKSNTVANATINDGVISVPNNSDVATTTPMMIGEMGTFDKLEITVTDYTFSRYTGALNGLNEAQDGLMNCVVYVDVKNTNTSSFDIKRKLGDYNFVLKNGEYEYLPSWASYTEFLHANDSIPANGTLKGKCVNFSVPAELADSDEELVLVFKYNSIYKNDFICWKLRGE